MTALNLGSLERACSVVFKTGLRFEIDRVLLEKIEVKNRKFRENDDFLRKKFLESQKRFAPPLNYVFHLQFSIFYQITLKKISLYSENEAKIDLEVENFVKMTTF